RTAQLSSYTLSYTTLFRSWLLFKERDDEARTRGDILEDAPLSVSTGRDLEEIAENRKSGLSSKAKSNGKPAARKRTASAQAVNRSEEHTSELQSRGHLVCR